MQSCRIVVKCWPVVLTDSVKKKLSDETWISVKAVKLETSLLVSQSVGMNTRNNFRPMKYLLQMKTRVGGRDVELPPVSPEIMRIASERHQKGMMCPWVYQVLSQVNMKPHATEKVVKFIY